MYTLNLNEIEIEPKLLEENKVFEDETKSAVVMLAVGYINLNYKDRYDPNILELKCRQAVHHTNG